jgi:hypothetical protein
LGERQSFFFCGCNKPGSFPLSTVRRGLAKGNANHFLAQREIDMARTFKAVGTRKLAFQALEPRAMMAGDVTVNVVNGDLVVTGDSGANEVAIFQTITDGQLIPGSFFVNGVNGTTINGGAGATFAGATRDFKIDLAGGSDRLTLGQGNHFSTFRVLGDLDIKMGNGANRVNLQGITVHDDASITTGTGGDNIQVRAIIGDPDVDGGHNDLTIKTGNGIDSAQVRHSVVRGDVLIDTGTGIEHDFVDLFQCSLNGNGTIKTGAGEDDVYVRQASFAKVLTIDTGANRDFVEINASDADSFFISLGSGNDQLRLRDASGRNVYLNGNGGTNSLSEFNSDFTGLRRVSNFQS